MPQGNRLVLVLLPEIAERFRDAFMQRLAQVGFDQDYRLTNEGGILEDLIDRFFSE